MLAPSLIVKSTDHRGSVIAAYDVLLNLDTAVKEPGVIDASLVADLDKLDSVKLEGKPADDDYIVLTAKPAIIKGKTY